jgi:calcineurin-like phosphoesterase family protein
VWFTSDLHLGHEKLAEIRGFDTIAEHDNQIIDTLDMLLGYGDILYVLGDISSGTNKAEAHALNLLGHIEKRARLKLIPGNHDSCHPSRTDSESRLDLFEEVFERVQPFMKRRIPGTRRRLWLSHFPWRGDGDREPGTERFPESRVGDNGTDFLLHGHLHCDEKWTKERSLHIGLDAWDLQPVDLETIHAMILDREKSLAA